MSILLVDSRTGSKELLPLIQGQGVEVTIADELVAGDFAFEGKGPDATNVLIGVERKTVRDMLNCIGTGRFGGVQLVRLHQMYQRYYLIVEGIYGCGMDGMLEEPGPNGWHPLAVGGRGFMHSMLERYLMSVEECSHIRIHKTSNRLDTARKVANLWHFWNDKAYEKHRATDVKQATHVEIKPWSLKRRIASELPGIGTDRSKTVAKHFRSTRQMIAADALDWSQIQGIGMKTARAITTKLGEETED